jgi:anti-sigma-K factor RskA
MSTHERQPQDECPRQLDVAPYVLGALEQHELESFDEHVAGCAQCRMEVSEMQAVVDELAASAPALVAPSELSERVLQTVRSTAEVLNAAGHEADRPSRFAERARRRSFAFAGAAAALAAIVAVVLVITLGGSSPTSERVILGQASGAARGAAVSLHKRGSHAELLLAHMPQPGAGRIYEVWLVRGKAPSPTDALFGVSSAGGSAVDIPGSLHGVKQVLVTSEPLGGSLAPTREPVIAVTL